MSNSKPYNAADPDIVGKAKREQNFREKRERDDLASVVSNQEGRRFIWRLLEHCSVFASIWEASAKIHYNAGRQDVGHFIVKQVDKSDPKAMQKMKEENRENEIL